MPLTEEQIEEMLANQQKMLEATATNMQTLQQDLAGALREMQKGTVQGVQEAILGLRESLGSRSDDEDDGGSVKPPNTITDADLEAMPRKQFMDFMMGNFKEVLTGELKGFRDDLAATRTETTRDRVARQIEEMRGKHDDFNDWMDEMKERLRKNPALSPKELYTLVRADDPEKAKKLDEKYEQARKDAAGDGGDGNNSTKGDGTEKKGFGGMRPGAGQGSGQSRSDMDKDEAFDAAWEASFGSDESSLLAS